VGTVTVLLVVLIVVACVLCAVGIWALIEAVKMAKSVRTLSNDLDIRLVPLIEKADVTVDALNAELLRVDAILTRFEEISDRVETTSRTVQEVANAPVEIVTDIADRVRRAWKSRRHSTAEGYGPQTSEAEHVTVESAGPAEPAETQDEAGSASPQDVPPTDTEENRNAHAQ
jgi:hypothetical protein